ncbi:MAG: alpha/beta fold hydrolase [Chloroflexi bacterium]|nr:alpha/beta fold hydrolase [Chloroflexota bacterium]
MSDPTPNDFLARTQAAPVNGRPVRKDEFEIGDRGVYVESWLPERRSRRKPLLFVHGELGGSWVFERYLAYFASRGWEGHALNLRNHHWSLTADPAELSFEMFVDDVGSVMDRLGSAVVVVGHGLGGLLAMKAAERHPLSGLVLVASELPGELRLPAHQHEIRDIPELYGRSMIGWETLPERLQRDHRDLSIADILRIQHLMGQKPHESGRARRAMLRGIRVDRRVFAEVPRLVIGAGLDRQVPIESAEQLAEWLDAPYEPFAAHSHYGLVVGEQSHQQVADAIRAFLEANRL